MPIVGRRPRQRQRGARVRARRWSVAEALAEAALARTIGSQLQMVQIGANQGDFDVVNHHMTIDMDPVRVAVRRLLLSEHTRAVLVEANPPIFAKLDAGLRRFLNSSSTRRAPVSAVNVMACASPASEPVSFYRVNVEKLAHDFPNAPYWARHEINSMNLHSVEYGLDAVWGHNGSISAKPYIETLPMQCESPRALLWQSEIEPGALDVLAVDAEGFDASIVEGFLNATARPSLILFEVHITVYEPLLRPTLRRLLRRLVEQHRYRVACCPSLCRQFLDRPVRYRAVEAIEGLPGRKRCKSHNAFAWDPRRLGNFSTLQSDVFQGRRQDNLAEWDWDARVHDGRRRRRRRDRIHA